MRETDRLLVFAYTLRDNKRRCGSVPQTGAALTIIN